MKRDKINTFKTAVKNIRWHILGTNLVSTTANIREEMDVSDFKAKLALLSEGTTAFKFLILEKK